MKTVTSGSISPLLRTALILTLLLTAGSFAVRYWREQQAIPVISANVPSTATLTASVPQPNATTLPAENSPALMPSEGLRAPATPASADAMASRKPPEPPASPSNAKPAGPPPPPPPSFRLIGAYADESRSLAIFASGNQVLVARPGDGLPEDFILKSLGPQRATVQRQSNKENIDMHLGQP